MAVRNINWDVSKNYIFKPVDAVSVLNKQSYVTQSAWESDEGLMMPTTKFWLNYKLTSTQRTVDIPFFYIEGILSSSFNRIIFPSIHATSFLTQSIESAIYYLDVYNSNIVPIEINQGEHLYNTHGIYADSPNLIFGETNEPSIGGAPNPGGPTPPPPPPISAEYITMGLIPSSRAFGIAWCDISGSGVISSSYLPFTYYTKPSAAMYGKYASILNQTNGKVIVGTGSADQFFAIHLDKNALKNGIIPGTIELPLMQSASFNVFTSSNIYNYNIISLTDYTESINNISDTGKYAYIVSGTMNSKNSNDIYGTIYYDLGILLLDSNKLNSKLNLKLNLNTYPFDPLGVTIFSQMDLFEYNLNTVKLFNSIQACSYKNVNTLNDLLITSSSLFSPRYFKCRVNETTVENPIYILVKPNEFIYSSNTSWQKRQLLDETAIVSASIPTSCDSFKKISVGCNELINSQEKYVYWYYPNKQSPEKIFAAYFTKNENGICNCEFLGDLFTYKKTKNLPHIKYKKALTKSEFINNPITYITSIGLYNENYELLAVGKLSKPLKNDQFSTYMFKITLKI